ncbi:MAG: flippase-like domain-containing protein [Atopobiaceae bacterium]|nr:flippase-like domain-containing protein [Atopobiaceae bacterium]
MGKQKDGTQQKGPTVRVSSAGAERREDMGSVRKSVLFLGVVAVAYFLYLLFSGELGTFVDSLAGADYGWVAVAGLCYVAYYVLGVLAYAIAVIGDSTSRLGILDLMSVEGTGIFFSNLTPNGTGGAPAQILRLTRSGLSVGAAGALQYTRFIIYEAGEGVFAALMLIPRMGYFLDTYGNVVLVGALLFGAKVVEVTGLLLVCLLPKQVSAVGNWGLRLVHGWGWIKEDRFVRWSHAVNEQIYEFSNGFKTGARNWRLMVLTLVVTLAQLGFQYALPWVVLQAFGRQADFLTCWACGSMLELLTSAIPLPGGTLGAEGGFAFLFGGMFGETLSAGYVVWRMVEYVLPVLAAVPLMGLRSKSGLSLNARLRRWRTRRGR